GGSACCRPHLVWDGDTPALPKTEISTRTRKWRSQISMISRSARRAAISTWCKSSSMPTQSRLSRRLATAVVPLPRNGSSTRSPSFVEANRQRSTKATGFWVGCLPKDFSPVDGADRVQTGFKQELISFSGKTFEQEVTEETEISSFLFS